VRRLLVLVFVCLAASAAWALRPTSALAAAFESTSSYDVEITIDPDGSIHVVETIAYDFGSEQHHGIYRDIPTRLWYDDTYDRTFPLRVDDVTGSPGTPVQYEVLDAGNGETEIRIGDPDQLITGQHTYRIAYTVLGALDAFADHDELYWNAIGDEWTTSIDRATVLVRSPGEITGVACFQGERGSSQACDQAESRGNTARFAQAGLFPFEGMTVVIGIAKGAVAVQPPILDERWDPARAFALTPVSGGTAGAIAVLGVAGFGYLAWTRGRDRRYVGSPIDQVLGNPHGESQRVPAGEADAEAPVEFAPPEGIRPGQVGTLIDERANTLDVSATIVDLAVRGFLVIHEIPKEGIFGKPDWRLVRLQADESVLLPYERLLLDGVFRDGDDTTLSSLRTTFAERLAKVEESLYVDAQQQGWFAVRPDKIRTRWRLVGFALTLLGAAVTIALAATTHLGLIGLGALLVGLVFLVGAKRMPARTAKGTAMLRRIRGFRQVIATADRYLARWAEQENVFPSMLAYAVVFGLTDKWAKTFASLAIDPATAGSMAWYVPIASTSIDGFAHAIDGFTVATSGTMTSTPAGSGASGFSGGFSGGGGGGGGGGSW
jgi:uncharacterized membrane protein YgcG